MIGRTAYGESFYPIRSGNPANVRPKIRFQVRFDKRITLSGAEGTVHEIFDVRVGHDETPFRFQSFTKRQRLSLLCIQH